MPSITRNHDITQEMTDALAGRAWFVFHVNPMDTTGYEGFEGNDYASAGEGIPQIDRMLDLMDRKPRARIMLDYGSIVEDKREIGPENLQDLREAYLRVYGNVERPDVYGQPDAG